MKLIRKLSEPICGAFLIFCLVSGQPAVGADWSTLPRITDKGIKSLIEKNRGKVLLLNFWATWCPPCVEEFPALVKIYNTYKSRGLEVIGVSLNDPSEMKDVLTFLREQKPSFPLYLAGTVDDSFYQSIDKRWSSEMPLTMIYDKSGRLRYFHNDSRTYTQFEKDLQSLLK
jgi:thiol-disulfide isomerase/thioredoxin